MPSRASISPDASATIITPSDPVPSTREKSVPWEWQGQPSQLDGLLLIRLRIPPPRLFHSHHLLDLRPLLWVVAEVHRRLLPRAFRHCSPFGVDHRGTLAEAGLEFLPPHCLHTRTFL